MQNLIIVVWESAPCNLNLVDRVHGTPIQGERYITQSSVVQTCVDEQFTVQQLKSDAVLAISMTTSACSPLASLLSTLFAAPIPILRRSLMEVKVGINHVNMVAHQYEGL
jgi:hypothetical protein